MRVLAVLWIKLVNSEAVTHTQETQSGIFYTTPSANIASATLMKPAIFAPFE